MRVIVCLAVFLVATNLSPGEALQCRMCKSSNEFDYCTAKPLLVGTHECGRHESNINGALTTIKSLLANESDLQTNHAIIQKLDQLMITLETQRERIDEYYVSLSNDSKPNSVKTKIEKIISTYKVYNESVATQRFYNRILVINEKLIYFANNITLDELFNDGNVTRDDIDKVAELQPDEILIKATEYNIDFKQKFTSFVKSEITPTVSTSVIENIQKLESHKETLIKQIAVADPIIAPAIFSLKKAVEDMGNNTVTLQALTDSIKGISVNDDGDESQKREYFLKAKTALNNFVKYATSIRNLRYSVTGLKSYNDLQPGINIILNQYIEDENKTISINLINLKKANDETIEAISTNGNLSTEWTCFKEIKDKLVTRGCTVKINATDEKDKMYRCNEDGCNSSNIISIGLMPIFIALAIGLLR